MIVAFSGGKDSGITLELAIQAAKMTGNLPVECVFRDDEILYPGTEEYVTRTYHRPEVKMHWVVNRQAEPNIFNRKMPYWWAFDWEMAPEDWVREPPAFAEYDMENINLYYMINPTKYPAPSLKKLVAVVGIRTLESRNRLFAIQSSKGARSYASDDKRLMMLYPIYDWTDGDIWKAYKDFKWDYNSAYDVMAKMGIPPGKQRLSQIAMSTIGLTNLKLAAKAWPRWFDRVCDRLPGIRQVVYYGSRALLPERRETETWKDCYQRTCIDSSPDWIVARSIKVRDFYTATHQNHAHEDLPEVTPCNVCKVSWKSLTHAMFSGDPFHISINWLPDVEPSEFRKSETRKWPKTHKLTKADISWK